MSIDNKQKINVDAYKRSENDCGSTEVQIAQLTKHIVELTPHCQENKKDNSAIRGMVRLVNQRKKLMRYLRKTNYASFVKIAKELNIRYRTSQ